MADAGDALDPADSGQPAGRAADPGLVKDSITVSSWTVVSRATGLCRLAVVAGVLGPTYLGNTFSAMNEIPNLVYFGLLGGSLFPPLLVPSIVGHLERADRRSAERVAGGFLGLVLAGLAVAVAAAVVFRPLIMYLFTLGAGSGVAADQRRAGGLLLVVLAPQILLYGVAGTARAVLEASGRFALAAGAPALENAGIILTLGVFAARFGTETRLDEVHTTQLLLLGGGTTASVAVHAAVVWAGARRSGIALRPHRGWRDPDVRQIVSRMRPALGHAGLAAVSAFAVWMLANRVSGGVVAFLLAETVCMLPIVVGASPIAAALVPRLARDTNRRDGARYADHLLEGVALAYFVAVPAAVGLLAFAAGIARAVSFGEMDTGSGAALVAAALSGLALGVLGEVAFQVGTAAAYARSDTVTPLRAMVLRSLVSAAGMVASLAFTGTAALLALGLALSVGTLVGAGYFVLRLAPLVPTGGGRLKSALGRTSTASFLMLIPAGSVAVVGRRVGNLPDWVATLAVVVTAAIVFLMLHARWRSPELGSVIETLRRQSTRET
ncbi:MAG TPA: lipid II flippase MurJ [Acidimicrobiia bacterium]|nr:lipid II flippase MurJ [Acidimicrobiia bacterium]